MDKSKKVALWLRRTQSIIILLYCAIVITCVGVVLLFIYEPDINSIRALGSVCLDVISILVMLMMVASMTIEKVESNSTSRLFLGLLMATTWALLMDFFNWALDGNLDFGDATFVFTTLSLCMGSVLGGIFVFYLSSYLKEMHGLASSYRSAKICGLLNLISFIITLILALTHNAFTYVDGHYQTGALYDIITVLPVLTLLYMTGYTIRYVKKVGRRDVVAVVGYILIMIAGALVESALAIGTTYVAICIANIFIYVMLQNKLIARVKKQKEILSEQVVKQYDILESMAGIYSYVNYVDLVELTVRKYDHEDNEKEKIDLEGNSHSSLNKRLVNEIDETHKEKFWEYTDLATLADRMAGEKVVTAEFCHKTDGWFRAQYIRIGDSVDAPLTSVIYAIRNIDEEKKNVEKWIRRSNTDELTGLYNRHAYEDDAAALDKGRNRKGLVYVSIDVNGLKNVNDTLGHDAGDALIIGASECMRQALGSYGRLYRTGGDEFVALIYADDTKLDAIKNNLDEITEKWRGKNDERMNLSCGYVARDEANGKTLHQLAVLADERMYEEKRRFYRKKGMDRRGQRDAHMALCALYSEILKGDLTNDSFEVVDLYGGTIKDIGNSTDKLSACLASPLDNGIIHPEDVNEYREKINVEYLSNRFKNDRSSFYLLYRKKMGEDYNKIIIEVIPATDYTDDKQTVFIYVKTIGSMK